MLSSCELALAYVLEVYALLPSCCYSRSDYTCGVTKPTLYQSYELDNPVLYNVLQRILGRGLLLIEITQKHLTQPQYISNFRAKTYPAISANPPKHLPCRQGYQTSSRILEDSDFP